MGLDVRAREGETVAPRPGHPLGPSGLRPGGQVGQGHGLSGADRVHPVGRLRRQVEPGPQGLQRPTPRIAIASGSAFLLGQSLDISVFNKLRAQSWWRAPLIGSLFGSLLDTVIFFSFAFAPFFVFFGPNDDFALASAPILGVMATEAPRWISWALGDLGVKILVGLVMLLPYGALMSVIRPMPGVKASA